jgi:anti-sigma factor RsiW
MWCKRVRTQLSAYVDGELALPDARAVDEHLARCESCASERASLQRFAKLPAIVPEEELPFGLHTRIMTSLAYAGSVPATSAAFSAGRSPFRGPWLYSALTGVALTGAAAAVAFNLLPAAPAASGRSASGQAPAAPPALPRTAQEVSPAYQELVPTPRMPETDADAAVILPPDGARGEAALEKPPAPNLPEKTVVGAPAPVIGERGAVPPKPSVRPARLPRPGGVVASREIRPLPVAGAPGRIVIEPRIAEPGKPAASQADGPGMPGDLVVGGQPETVMASMEKDATTRMAGAPMEGEGRLEEEEGFRMLKMFFDERNRQIPQPPVVDPNSRRMRKSL